MSVVITSKLSRFNEIQSRFNKLQSRYNEKLIRYNWLSRFNKILTRYNEIISRFKDLEIKQHLTRMGFRSISQASFFLH